MRVSSLLLSHLQNCPMTVAKTRDIQRLLKTLICFGIQQYISNPYFVPNSYEFSLLEIEPFFFSSSPHSSVPHDSCSYCRFYQKVWFVMFVCYCLLKSVKTTFSYQQETFKIFKSMPLSLLAAIKQKWQVAVWKKQDMFIL